ncbi:MAG TPA: LysM peptidoglycan-binding domain-containing protein [Spirochaetes bacterium]|nr:LysM peptidoglycan-binding domain-containing protein [Spirochaetota bacterium]
MINSNVFVDCRIKPEFPFFDKKRALIENQKITPKKGNITNTSKQSYLNNSINRPRSGPSVYSLIKTKKSALLFSMACFLIFVSILPLYININSYFWEKKRVLQREKDIIYNKFLIDGIEGRTVKTVESSDISYSLLSLKEGIYTVKKGDSLFGISHKFNISVDTLITANDINNARYLKIGAKLKIPNMNGIYYTVKKGDSLSGISKRYGVSVNKIVDLNDLSSSVINVRQRIFIQGGTLTDWERSVAIGNVFKHPAKGRLTSKVGFRVDPFTKKRTYHAGIDIANRIGTRVTAAQYGKVIFTGYRGNYGRTVIIMHPNGYKTLYAHLHKITIKRGQAVKQGEIIGSIGNSGRSTGPHLHFEVQQNNKVIDPLKILKHK